MLRSGQGRPAYVPDYQKMLIHNSFGMPHLANHHTLKGARD
jgi:hypothetical protein